MSLTQTDVIKRLEKAGLKPPKSVTIAITDNCNLFCGHCWLNSGPEKQVSVVPKNKLLQLIEDFSNLGVEKFTITGGEPLTHPEWPELISFVCSRPRVKQVRLQTNGILITPLNVETILSFKDQGLIIQTSLEGATPLVHDRVRGAGSFAQTLLGLELLEKVGMASQVCITLTEMQHNFDDIPELLKLADKMGVGQFVTGTLVCGGRAAQSDSLVPPVPAQYEKLLRLYQKDTDFKERYERLGNIAALEWFMSTGNNVDTCCSFIETPYVTVRGNLYPCIMLHADNYAAIGIYKRSLAVAISEKIDLWSKLKSIKQFRLSRLKACQECPYYRRCGAGCMGRAYEVYKDFFTVEDRCDLRKAVYRWQSDGQTLESYK